MTTLLPGNFETFRADVPSGSIEEMKDIILNVLCANPELEKDLRDSKMNAQGKFLDALEGMERFVEIQRSIGVRDARKAVCLALNEIPN